MADSLISPGSIGIATDIHGNPYALRAVLADGAADGVDRWLILGDVVAMGPEPDVVLDLLAGVDVLATLRGNTERYVLTGDRPDPTFDEVAADPTMLPRLVEVEGSFAWTKGFLTGRGLLDTLRSFVLTERFALPDATRLLVVHASQVRDDGQGIAPDVGRAEMGALFPDPDASLVFGGHTHESTDVEHDGVRFVNPGSVSNHHRSGDGARYSILRVATGSHTVEHREVDYDKGAAIASIRSCGIPGAEFLLRRYFGENP